MIPVLRQNNDRERDVHNAPGAGQGAVSPAPRPAGGQQRGWTGWCPAADRRPCLMQDPIYRTDVLSASMGYLQVPMTGYDLESARKKER